MHDTLWFPFAAVLALGLAAGLYLARRRAAGAPSRPPYAAGLLAGLAVAAIALAAVALTEPPVAAGGAGAPAADPPSATTSAPAPPAIPQHASGRPLGAAAQARVAALEARVAADPGDLLARKEIALLRLRNDQLMSAFEQASEVLRAQDDDPDGLYVQGVVRLRMGQSVRSIRLLERLLSSYPDHVLGLVTLGKAQRRIGDQGGARRSWNRALDAAGGRHPEIERLLAGGADTDTAPRTAVKRPLPRLVAAHDVSGGGRGAGR